MVYEFLVTVLTPKSTISYLQNHLSNTLTSDGFFPQYSDQLLETNQRSVGGHWSQTDTIFANLAIIHWMELGGPVCVNLLQSSSHKTWNKIDGKILQSEDHPSF